VSAFSILTERSFHSYRADFPFLLSGFSIFTEGIFHFYRAYIPFL
jgi:hypothetical protein